MELEELLDVLQTTGARVRFGEDLEPLEVARVRGRGPGDGLDVGREREGEEGGLAQRARLREELAVLLEDLEVLLRFVRRGLGEVSWDGSIVRVWVRGLPRVRWGRPRGA